MEAEWRAFLKRTRAYHISRIGLLAEGQLRVAEVRDGALVDATSETLAQHRKELADVEEVLAKFGES